MKIQRKSRTKQIVPPDGVTYMRRLSDEQVVETYHSEGDDYTTTRLDEIHYSTRPVPETNDCTHLEGKRRFIFFSGDRYYSPAREYYAQCFNAPIHYLEPSPLNSGFVADDDFNGRAFQAMYPSLETALNLTNFILELTDIRSLWKYFRRWQKRVRSWSNRLEAKRSKLTSKDISDAHLSWAFGIKPMIDDMMKLYQILTSIEKRIDDFIKRSRSVQVRHYKEVGEWEENVTYPYSNATWRYENTVKERSSWFASMKYTYKCPDLSTQSARIKAIRDMLGLNPGLHNIWEKIPFSFVVDWFWRVGDFLKQFQEPLIHVEVTVLDYCISNKIEYDHKQRCRLLDRDGQTFWVPTYEDAGKKYYRRRTLPNSGVVFINQGQYGLNQLALSASLINGMRR